MDLPELQSDKATVTAWFTRAKHDVTIRLATGCSGWFSFVWFNFIRDAPKQTAELVCGCKYVNRIKTLKVHYIVLFWTLELKV